jgi:hypothetical protein
MWRRWSASALSLTPIEVLLSISFAPVATTKARITMVTVTWLTTTPSNVKAGPEKTARNVLGLVPKRMKDREIKSRSAATVTAERALVVASGNQVAIIQPSPADINAPQMIPRATAGTWGMPIPTNETATKAPNMPTAACAKLMTRTNWAMRVRQTAMTA